MNIIQKIKLNNPEKENLQNTLYEIDTLSKRWTGIQKSGESDSEAIQKNIETTISASLSLENIPYTALQIQKIIARQKATNDKKQSLITGYNTVLKALYTHPHNYPLLEGTIVTIHAALFPNGKIHSNDEPAGKPSVVNFLDYKAPTLFSRNQAVSVNNEIRDLVEWTNDELSKHEHHALVVIAAFAYEFISIHPFREGKGELSRILSTLLLLQNGYEWAKFESIDNLIEKRRTEYYGTLKEGQQNRYSSREDISAWILFLCDIWLQSIRNLVPAPLTETPPHTRFDGYSPTKQEYNVTLCRTGQPACLSERPAKTDIVFHGRRRPGKSKRHHTSSQTRVHQHDKKRFALSAATEFRRNSRSTERFHIYVEKIKL